MPRLVLLGVGAMHSPRYRPAGLLVSWADHRVMLDGGGAADPHPPVDAWLVSDEHAELMPQIRCRASELGVRPAISPFQADDVWLGPLAVRHLAPDRWLPDRDGPAAGRMGARVLRVPRLGGRGGSHVRRCGRVEPTDPVRGGAGGHACVRDTAVAARRAGVQRLVFAHIGRPSIKAIDRGEQPPFGQWGSDGAVFRLR